MMQRSLVEVWIHLLQPTDGRKHGDGDWPMKKPGLVGRRRTSLANIEKALKQIAVQINLACLTVRRQICLIDSHREMSDCVRGNPIRATLVI